jgi:hypothetical protein
MMRGVVVFLFAMCVSLNASAQQSARRVALVIGNSAYVSQGALANPGPDSRLVAGALQRVGFSVTTLGDQGKQGMERALRDFARAADGAEVALVYYAGHGMEANGVNWLIPVDATLADERDLSFEAISLDTVLATVDRARGLRMVVLDACRNNPFTRSMRRGTSSTRAVTRGLADVEVTGTLVLYAARGGSLAQDGPAGGNSPFAAALARRIPEPGVDVRLLVSKVRDDVLAATGRGQEPFSYGSLPGVELVLSGTSASPRPAVSTPAPAIAPVPETATSPYANSEWYGEVQWRSGLNPTTGVIWKLRADGGFTSSGESMGGRWESNGATLRLNYAGDRPVVYTGRVDGDTYTGVITLRDQPIGSFRLQRVK